MAVSVNHSELFEDFEGLFESESFADDSMDFVDFSEGDLEGFDDDSVQSLADQINDEMEGMSPGEAESYLEDTFSEAFPLLIPLISALAPTIIQGVTSLIGNAANRPAAPQTSPQRTPPPRQTAPQRPAPRPAPRPAASPTNPASSAASLLGLLQNPAVIQAITGIVQSAGGGGSSQAGAASSQVVDLLLGTLSQLAANTRTEAFGESATDYPDFLFDAEGNLTADPFAPEQMADLLTYQLQH